MKKRLLGLMIAVMMVITSYATAFAAPQTTHIRVNSQHGGSFQQGTRIQIYRVFDVVTDGVSAYSYTISTKFKGLTVNFGGANNFNTNTEAGMKGLLRFLEGEANNSNVMAHFANTVYSFAVSKGYISATGAIVPVGDNGPDGVWEAVDSTKASTGYEFDNMPMGYYMIYGSIPVAGEDGNQRVFASASLFTNDDPGCPNEVYLKVGNPTLTKEIKNGENKWTSEGGTASTSAAIGDVVEYRLISTAPYMLGYKSSGYQYIIHDEMSKGLDFNASSVTVSYYLEGEAINDTNKNTIPSANYAVTTPSINSGEYAGGNKMVITFNKNLFYDLFHDKTNAKIVVEYNCTLNRHAVITESGSDGQNGNPNRAQLEYSSNSYITSGTGSTAKTPWSIVTVFTFPFEIYKYYDVSGTKTPLAGTKFEIYKGTHTISELDTLAETPGAIEAIRVNFTKFTVGTSPAVTWYRVNPAGTDELVSDADGAVRIIGLKANDYYGSGSQHHTISYYTGRETVAPVGYNNLTSTFRFEIKPTYVQGILTPVAAARKWPTVESIMWSRNGGLSGTPDKVVEIENSTGVELPETGGIGTAIFTAAGMALMLFSATFFISKRQSLMLQKSE